MKSGDWDVSNIAEAKGCGRVNLGQYGALTHRQEGRKADPRKTSERKGARATDPAVQTPSAF